ncbi:hypothetical protein AB0J38_41205 [Streptomyces sp. NPDC050095]|uniref:hypothetical protein n=1 Tax=unclassified Streptomyces TaxID=2593676 RepID=UPI0034202984
MALFNDLIEVHRALLVLDDYGSHRDWENPTVVWSGLGAAVPYARVAKADNPNRETSTSRITCYLPGDITVDSADRLLFQGRFWALEGQAWKWRLGSRRYTMLAAKEVTK